MSPREAYDWYWQTSHGMVAVEKLTRAELIAALKQLATEIVRLRDDCEHALNVFPTGRSP